MTTNIESAAPRADSTAGVPAHAAQAQAYGGGRQILNAADTDLAIERLWSGVNALDTDAAELRAALRLHLVTGHPYRFRIGLVDKRAAQLARRLSRTLLRAGDGQTMPLWSLVGRSGDDWADVALTDGALDKVAQVRRCWTCDGAGFQAPDDRQCTVCKGHGRVVERSAPRRAG